MDVDESFGQQLVLTLIDWVPLGSRTDLQEALNEQLQLLRDYCVQFDVGGNRWAKPMATCLRVLLHETKSSHALLEQLGLLSTTSWKNTASPVFPQNLATSWGLVYARMTAVDDEGTLAGSWMPRLDEPVLVSLDPNRELGRDIQINAPGRSIQFGRWWLMPIIRDDERYDFSRKDIIMYVTNKDGGAHLDPNLPREYERLSRLNSLGPVTVSSDGVAAVYPDPVAATVRQIAHEVLKSLGARGYWPT